MTSTKQTDKPTHDELNSLNHQNGTAEKNRPVYKQRSSMTLSERLDLPLALLSVPFVAIFAILTGPFRARKQKLNPKQTIARSMLLHVGYSIFRRCVARLSPLQIQCVFPPILGALGIVTLTGVELLCLLLLQRIKSIPGRKG